MFRPASSWPGALLWLAAVTAALLAPSAVRAQADFNRSEGDLQKGFFAAQGRFDKLMTGEEAPVAADKDVIDAMARYFIHRMGVKKYETVRGKYHDIARDFEAKVKDYAVNHFPKNSEALKLFTEQVVKAFRPILSQKLSEDRLTVVNAALLLPIYAKVHSGTKHSAATAAFGAYLEELLKDEQQHDVVKLYAVKALREYFPVHPERPSGNPKDKVRSEQLATEARRLELVRNFVERDKTALPDDVLRFIRREAIQTLAAAQAPAMGFEKSGKAKVPAALTLLRVLSAGKDTLSPAPALSEKVEAAVGVCKLKATEPGMEDYQPEPGLYLVGQLLLEFATEYNKDYVNFGGKVKKEDRKVPAQAWKVQAERLDGALQELKTNVPAKGKAAGKLKGLVDGGKEVLSAISRHQRVEQLPALRAVVNALAPPSGALFKRDKDVQIEITAPAVGD